MRRRLPGAKLAVIALCILGAAGCKEGGDQAEEVKEASSELTSEQEALLQRRDALLNSRRKLREKRRALAEERRRVVESGGDPSEVDRKVAQLDQEEAQLGRKEAQLADDFEALLTEQRTVLSALASQGDDAAQLAAREAGLAAREQKLSRRESRLAEREAELAERERRLAIRERETCSAAAAPAVIQAPAPAGTQYTRRDVEPILRRARRLMSRKGVLRSDLPAPARGLEQEATRAMGKGDYGQGRFAASQLLATVRSMAIDKAFIRAKIDRLNAAMRGAKLRESARSKAEELFKQATSSYGDGEFRRANRRLNEIYDLIRG